MERGRRRGMAGWLILGQRDEGIWGLWALPTSIAAW